MALIELHHMGVTRGGQEILKDVNMMVDKGEMVTITGPSGSGKSTLVRVIASLMSETSGEVRYDGKQVSEYDPVMYRRRVSYSMQQPTLFGDSVRDNLAFPYDIRKVTFDEKRAIEASRPLSYRAITWINQWINCRVVSGNVWPCYET